MPRQVPLLRPGADPKPRCPGVDAPLRRDSAGVRRAVQSKIDVVPPSEDNDLLQKRLKDDLPLPRNYLIFTLLVNPAPTLVAKDKPGTS